MENSVKMKSKKQCKTRKKGNTKPCIIRFKSMQSFKIDDLSDSSWGKLRNDWSDIKFKGSKTTLWWNLQKCTDWICYGYHKECYSKFTNLKYLKAIKWKSDQDPEVELSIKKKNQIYQ